MQNLNFRSKELSPHILVEINDIVELPIPDEQLKKDMLQSLKESEQGEMMPYDSVSFKKRFLAICEGHIK